MPIFRYTFKKIIATPSTWIIFALTVFFLGLMWALVASTLSFEGQTHDGILLMYLPTWKSISFFVLLGMMLFIFIAIKTTQIFRDEIDDGTLLILVSKPVSRTKIWAEKLLSLQVIIVLYLFLSIFIASIVLLIPGAGNTTVYATMFPYLWILFGVGIIFDLIISSLAVLLSLIVNAKALVAIMIGTSALFFIFANLLPTFVATIDDKYINISQAVAVYNNIKNKVKQNDLDWIKDAYTKENLDATKTKIKENMKALYESIDPSLKYPDKYDYVGEQKALKAIANTGTLPDGTPLPPGVDKDLSIHIYNIGNAFRQWKEQSFEQLMTGKQVGIQSYVQNNYVQYSVVDMTEALQEKLTQVEYDAINSSLTKAKVMRYLNIFYQLNYLWNGTSNFDNSIFVTPSAYTLAGDPYLINFKKDDDKYVANTDKFTNRKILNIPTLLSVYLLIGLALFGSSWFVFNRRDFA